MQTPPPQRAGTAPASPPPPADQGGAFVDEPDLPKSDREAEEDAAATEGDRLSIPRPSHGQG